MNQSDRKELIDLFFNKISHFLNYVFPGVFVLEVVFHRGFFSNPPKDFVELSLFSLWAIILSIPINSLHPNAVDNMLENVVKELSKKYPPSDELTDESFKDANAHFEFLFIMIKLCIFYICLKVVVYIGFTKFWLGINTSIWHFVFSSVGMLLLSYPVGWFYSYFMKKYLINLIDKSFEQQSRL